MGWLVACPELSRLLRRITILLVVCGLAGCSAKRLEDMLGPSQLLIQPPQDLTATAGQGQFAPKNTNLEPNFYSAELEDDQQPAAFGAAEQLSPIPAAQENANQFSDSVQWQVFRSSEGYDATNASGTMCSGRLIGGDSRIMTGQKIPLACSDGKSATLQVSGLTQSGAIGQMIIDKDQQAARIADTLRAQ
jgi:hypothetical protein